MSDLHEIFKGNVTIETLLMLHEDGFEFVISGGRITEVIA